MEKAEEGLPAGTIVGATTAELDGKPVQTCTMAFPDIDQEVFRKGFFTRTDAEKIAEERTTTQVSRLYILIAGGREKIVRLAVPISPAAIRLPTVIGTSIMRD